MPWDHNQQPWALMSTYSWPWFLECGIIHLNISTEEQVLDPNDLSPTRRSCSSGSISISPASGGDLGGYLQDRSDTNSTYPGVSTSLAQQSSCLCPGSELLCPHTTQSCSLLHTWTPACTVTLTLEIPSTRVYGFITPLSFVHLCLHWIILTSSAL